MAYKMFYTDVPMPAGKREPDFSKLMPFEFSTFEETVAKARVLLDHGAIVWKIDGPGGIAPTRPTCAISRPSRSRSLPTRPLRRPAGRPSCMASTPSP